MSIKNPKSKIQNPKFILVGILLFLSGIVFAQENLEELRETLLEQEVVAGQGDIGNKGYIYSTGVGEIKEGRPVYIMPEVQIQINELYREAGNFYRQGMFEEAKVRLERILELNPLHVPAMRFLEKIVDKEIRLSSQDNVITAKERMVEVDKAWLPPVRKGAEEISVRPEAPEKTPQQKFMEEKAQQIIPEINFTDAHIRDVLKYLSDISGINIVVDEDIFPKMPGIEAVPGRVEVTTTGEVGAVPTAPTSIMSDRITISLVNIPLIEALKYILSAKGLKYRIDEYAIVVSTPERLGAVEMETRYYHLAAGVGIFTEFAKRVKYEEREEGEVAARGLKAEAKVTIKDVLEQSGVPFPAGSKVFLDKRTGTLIVRNTPQNLYLVEEVLKMLDITPFQVEIEARFIEVTQGTAQELGLEWMVTSSDYRFGNDKQYRWDLDTTDVLYGQYPDPLNETGREGVTHGLRYLEDVGDTITKPKGAILSISGILSKPEFRMILHALNQSGFSDVLSAPKITTLNNQQAQIEVVKEIIYPTEFELTPATTNDAGTVVTQPVVTPASFTTRDTGIILNVTPSVGADRKTINLVLRPEVSKLIRWEDYGIEGGENWNDIPILQPIFFTKNVETSVVIHDGETVVLGGLIKEDSLITEDKIPLLGDIPIIGRLFRTNTETTQKTNLLIFVTANLLTPTGERIRVE